MLRKAISVVDEVGLISQRHCEAMALREMEERTVPGTGGGNRRWKSMSTSVSSVRIIRTDLGARLSDGAGVHPPDYP